MWNHAVCQVLISQLLTGQLASDAVLAQQSKAKANEAFSFTTIFFIAIYFSEKLRASSETQLLAGLCEFVYRPPAKAAAQM